MVKLIRNNELLNTTIQETGIQLGDTEKTLGRADDLIKFIYSLNPKYADTIISDTGIAGSRIIFNVPSTKDFYLTYAEMDVAPNALAYIKLHHIVEDKILLSIHTTDPVAYNPDTTDVMYVGKTIKQSFPFPIKLLRDTEIEVIASGSVVRSVTITGFTL